MDAGAVRASYDAVTDAYASSFFEELTRKPFDRGLLDAFCRACPPGSPVLDVGTGPGHVARHLRESGLDAAGVDLSPAMVDTARRLSPDITFSVGDMRCLDHRDGSLAGLTAFYSVIHIPRDIVPEVLREFHRVLVPGGRLLVAVHGGAGVIHRDEFMGRPVPFEATLFSLAEITAAVEAAGFWVDTAHQRAPYEFEHATPRIYVEAHVTA